jgi:hypothetical protein
MLGWEDAGGRSAVEVCTGDAGTRGDEWVGVGEVGERDAAKESDAYIGKQFDIRSICTAKP